MSPVSKLEELTALLADLDDAEVLAILDGAEHLATGIGGATSRVRLQGSDIFVKHLPLTAIEKDDPISTINRFGLPVSCHYGIGSPGFGVGREIATHQLTSKWVTSGATAHFPVLYHWRVLDQRCRVDVSEFDGAAPQLQWGSHWPRVRARVEALATARSSVVLFLEYVPQTLDMWLREQFSSGDGTAALSSAIKQIVTGAAWMDAHGMQHFDLHPRNILVRDGAMVFTDFGLALHQDFAMNRDERAFFAAHGGYDHATGIASLLHWVLAELGIGSRTRRLEVLRAAASDHRATELDPFRAMLGDGADLIAQYAPIGVTTTAFFDALMQNASATTYSGVPR
ncbi:MAG: protein kinase domain-containing protein [Microbacterium gubbeenense]|uniref:protein kinase domain-containing protein n=1 Tax=Microbacterium gubbeenense TaxID=159896 RepID=UPI003F97AEDA